MWETVLALGSGIVRLNPPLGCFGGWGLFVVGISWPVLSGDFCGSAGLLGGGRAVGRGFGGSDPRVGSSPDPHAQPVLQALAFHTMVMVGRYRGALRDVLPDCWVGLVAPLCHAWPWEGASPQWPQAQPGVGEWVPSRAGGPTRAARLLARDQAQNKPRLSGQAGSWGRKYPFPHPGICLPQRAGPLRGVGPRSCSLTKGAFFAR